MQASTPIATGNPGATNVVAWDAPPAIVAGERFRMKVGIKCSPGCERTSRDFGIYDHQGTQVARGRSADPWPGTTGLYVAEVELQAPPAPGLYAWSARSLGSDAGVPRADGSTVFGVQVVGQPEYRVTVEAVDKASQKPIGGVRVVMHPYKTVADEQGVAEIRASKGAYTLFVSQTRYVTFRLPIEVTADRTVRTELEWEPVVERN